MWCPRGKVLACENREDAGMGKMAALALNNGDF
jgi:hypothetical protein